MNGSTATILAMLAVLLGNGAAAPLARADDPPPWPDTYLDPPTDITYAEGIWTYHGDVLASGNFQWADAEVPTRSVGRWNGRAWEPLSDSGPAGAIGPGVIWQDRLVVVRRYLGEPAHLDSARIVAWDGKTWEPVGSSLRGAVSALAAWGDRLAVAGDLQIAPGASACQLALWDGVGWSVPSPGPAGGGRTRISALAVHGDELAVGGVFSTIGGIAAGDIALFDGRRWRAPGAGANGEVRSLASWRGELYAAGAFTCIGGAGLSYLAAWDGAAWHEVGTAQPFGERRDAPHVTLTAAADGLWCTGRVSYLGGESALLRWDGAGWDTSRPDWFSPGRHAAWGAVAADTSGPSRPWHRRVVHPPAAYGDGVVILSTTPPDCSLSDRTARIDRHDQAGWREPVYRPRGPGRLLGVYRDAPLLAGAQDEAGLRPLFRLVPGGNDTLGWVPRLEPQELAADGDTLVAFAGVNGSEGKGRLVAHLFDGRAWSALGDLPGDWGSRPRPLVQGGRIFGVGERLLPKNPRHRFAPVMVQWEGNRWRQVWQGSPQEGLTCTAAAGGLLFQGIVDRPQPAWRATPTGPGADGRIRRWTGRGWQTEWTADAATVHAIVPDGAGAWAFVLIQGRASLLRRDADGSWHPGAPGLPRQPRAPTWRGPWPQILVVRGVPVCMPVKGPDQAGRGSEHAAWLDGDRWRTLGPPLTSIHAAVVAGDRLWLAADQVPYAGDERNGLTWWEGPPRGGKDLPTAPVVAPRARPPALEPAAYLLDLPWPIGVKPPRPRGTWGWHSLEPERYGITPAAATAELRRIQADGDTLRITADALEQRTIAFTFPVKKGDACQVTFRYRLAPAAGDTLDPVLDGSLRWLGAGRWPAAAFGGHDPVSTAWSPLAPADGRWHQVTLTYFVPDGAGFGALQLGGAVWDRPHTHAATGDTVIPAWQSVEICGLQVRRHDPDDQEHRDRLMTALEAAYWPFGLPAELSALDDVVAKERRKSADGTYVPNRTRQEAYLFDPLRQPYRGLDAPGLNLLDEIRRAAGAAGSAESDTLGGTALRAMLVNAGWHDGFEGWIPGGVAFKRIESAYQMAGAASSLVASATAGGADGPLRGAVLDLRRFDPHTDDVIAHYAATAEALSSLGGSPQPWAFLTDGPPGRQGTVRKPLAAPASRSGPPPCPVVVLVGPRTPGSVLLYLRGLPAVTTMGRPSAPALPPTRAVSLGDGRWVHVPAGAVLDPVGREVTMRPLDPDVVLPAGLPADAQLQAALRALGIEPDPTIPYCPR